MGIAQEELDHIFSPFEQVGNIQQRAQGTGLGLAISRQIARLMGGDIRVSSTPGQGSRFRFEAAFPVVDAPVATTLPEDHRMMTGYQGARRTLLIVDDKAENRKVLRDALEPLGFIIHEAEDGREGVQKAAELQPDIILMDLVMPVMTGFEAALEIRKLDAGNSMLDTGSRERDNSIQHPAPSIQRPASSAQHPAPSIQPHIPIIAISASVLSHDPQQVNEKGFDAFVLKPVDLDDLFRTLQQHLALEWTYDDTVSGHMHAEPGAGNDDIIPPSQDELEVLYELAMMGLLDRIDARVAWLAQRNAQYAPFADTVKCLTAAFEDEQMIGLLEQYLNAEQTGAQG